MKNIRLKESIGGSHCRYYQESSGERGFISTDLKSNGEAVSIWNRIIYWVKDVFLPQGYPDSVSADYLEFEFWNTFQVICSSLITSLVLHSNLQAAGVGDKTASAVSATLAWMQKDVSYMLSTIAFTYAKSTHMSSNCKQWRFFADLANDAALVVQLSSPVCPLPLSATMCLTGVMLGLVSAPVVPANMALLSHQARRGNLADIKAKSVSQMKLVRLVAVGLSALLVPLVSHSFMLKAFTSSALMCLHVFANYRAVRAVRMATLNRPRLLALLDKWFSASKILSVEEVNKNEPLFIGPAYMPNYLPYGFSLKIGCSLSQALNSVEKTEASLQFEYMHDLFRNDDYMLLADFQKKKMFLIYHEDIAPEEELEGFFLAYLCMLHFVSLDKNVQIAMVNTTGMKLSTPSGEIIRRVKSGSHAMYHNFKEAAIEKGWKVDPVLLAPDEWRYKFTQTAFTQEN